MHCLGNYLRSHPLVHLDSLFRGVADHPAVGALGYMSLQLPAKFFIRCLVEIVVEILQELFTCKQKRRPLFA